MRRVKKPKVRLAMRERRRLDKFLSEKISAAVAAMGTKMMRDTYLFGSSAFCHIQFPAREK